MARHVTITGSSSGIGRALKARLEAQGDTVVGIDLREADIIADLGNAEDRRTLPERVRELSPRGLDAVIAVAGVTLPSPVTVQVNYFGAVDILRGLRPLLVSSPAPRAVAVSSFSVTHPFDEELLQAILREDQEAATKRVATLAQGLDAPQAIAVIYATSKRALSEWIRRESISDEWAGAGIPLNAIAPGVVNTPMMAAALATPEGRAAAFQGVPMPLNGAAEPESVAALLDWLASAENTHITGQTIFIDGGAQATVYEQSRETL
ncbi:SDR family oxidoreductase [Leucobacter chromiireducens]|uniref:SDR family oxidoreductase n=1 Tax=Leucobacter chromiireducens subsp. solipictus TaxID=398235 RepID=A0ABS1SFX3_9MICO|nr:SDR family oxidoreductase [Leucobacter chromiireducens]MBL3678766.1 SDR family oxidoreductase [Leucobacter chromiireducens subsp. solipictus]